VAEDEPEVDEEFQDAFARIEASLDAGDLRVGRLGYWRLLRQGKAEFALSQHWAEQVGRIDRKLFERRVRMRFPVWLGNAVLVLGLAFGGLAVVVGRRAGDETLSGIAFLVAAGAWSVSVHDLAHWLVGRWVGIRFIAYFFKKQFPPRPGIKTDFATYLRAEPALRAWMHASGALATKAAPFAVLGFIPGSNAPAWAFWPVLGLGLVQIATDVRFSTKTSDWMKVRRELAAARGQFARGR